MNESRSSSKPRGRARRVVLWGVGALLLVVVLLVALAPTIAGAIAPAYAADAINKSINGKATVGGISLSWFGGQRVGPVTVADTAGKQVASVSLELSRGLWSLARAGMGGMDFGEVKVSGSANVVRGPDGKLNILSLAKPASPAAAPSPGGGGTPSTGTTLPKGLRAVLVIDKLSLEYTDQQAKPGASIYHFAAPDLSGRASIEGGNADATLNGGFDFQRTAQAKPEPGGSIALKASVTGLADSTGKLTPDQAKVDADLRIKDLAVAIADALAGMDNKLVAGVGEKLQASLVAKGSLSDADATITASSTAIDANLAFKSAAGVITTPKPGTISIKTAGMMPLLGLDEALKNQDSVTLQRLPDFAATLDNVRIPLPINGKPLDLRGGTFVLDIKSTETVGSVRVPNADGSQGQPQAYRLAPLTAKLASEDLAKKVSFTANTNATLGGHSAGALAANFDAIEPLDAAGKPRQGMPGRVQGQVTLAGVATAIAQPFVAAAGVDLAKDVGPTLDLSLKAAAGDEEAGTPPAASSAAATAGSLAQTHMALDLKSANVNAIARLLADAKTIRTKPKGVELKVTNLGPLATRFMQKSGLSVDSATSLTVTLTDLVADLEKLAPKTPGAQPDLRAVTGLVKIEMGATAGKLAVAGQPVKSYELAPLIAMLDAKDLAKGVTLKADTSAKLDGAPAGIVAINLAATNLLAQDGTLSKSLPAVNGTVGITDISTAIAQPFVESAGLDLPSGVGPKLAVSLVAASKGGEAAPGAIPATDLDLGVKSAGVNSALALSIDGRTIKKRGGDGFVSLKSPGTLAGKAAKNSGVALSDGGYAKATFRDFAVQFDEAWKPQLDRSAVDVELNVGGFSIGLIPKPPASLPGQPSVPAPRAAEPLALGSFVVNTKLEPGAIPTVDLKGSGKHQNSEFFMQGAMQLVGLLGKDEAGKPAITPADLRPLGTLDINNLPTSLASMAIPAPAPDGKPAMDVARLVRDAVGPNVTIKLASSKPAAGGEMARDVAFNVASANVNGSAAAVVDDKALALNRLDFKANMTQELAASFIDMLGAGLASKPTLAVPAAMTLTATPFTVPLASGKPDFAKASGDASLKMGIQGRTLVNNVVLKGEGTEVRNIGTVGLENVMVSADVPLQALAAGSTPKLAKATVTAGVLGGPDRKIVDLNAGGQVNLAAGKPQGDLNADLSLKVLDARWLDTFLNQPGLIGDGIGETATVEAKALVRFPKDGAAVPAGSAGAPPAFESAAVTASIKSPRLSTTQPLKATALPDRFALDAPMVAKWNIDPAWANKHLLTPKDAKPGYKLPAQFAAATDLTVSVFKLGAATGSDNAPMKPGVFTLDASVESPGTTFAVGEGKKASQAVLKNLKTRITGGKDPGVLGFSLTIDEAAGGPGPGGKPAVSASGGVYSVSDETGKLTPDKAKITATANATAISVALVDAIANQNGVLLEALGPTASMDVDAQGLSKTAGNLSVVAKSPRADAQIKGSIHDGTFVASGQPDIKLKVITPELGGMLVNGLPMVGTFEKKAEDGPAVITATGLAVPIDGQLQKLNGKVVLDMGKARFQTSGVFSKLLKFTGQKQAGEVGRNLQPITVDVKDGVATYDKVTIPLGEFNLATRGTVDLVQKKLDVITYIPFGVLTDEAAGLFNTGAGKLVGGAIPGLEKATMVPFRTKGTFEKQETKPDIELFGKEFLTNLRPDKAVGNVLDDLLKKKKDK